MQTLIYRDPQRRAALAATGRAVHRAQFARERTKRAYLAVYGVDPAACARPSVNAP